MFGHERLELIEFFAGTHEFDWAPRYFAHRQGSATARVTVELGQNDSTDLKRVVEMRGDTYGLLASRRVNHEQNFPRLQEIFELLEFVEERFIDFLTSSGIEDVDAGQSRRPLVRARRGTSPSNRRTGLALSRPA